jgi:predicted nucleic acid binding AN1-type Zn finger protein
MKCPSCDAKCCFTDLMDCKKCDKEVCIACRLPENHKCPGLDMMREEQREKLKAQLESTKPENNLHF